MPVPFPPLLRPLCLFALVALGMPAMSQSLQEKRLALLKGTAPGVVLIEDRAKPSSPTETAEMGADGKPVAKAAAASSNAQAGFLSTLPPPSGKPMRTTGQLDNADRGVTLRTRDTPAKPEPEAKP